MKALAKVLVLAAALTGCVPAAPAAPPLWTQVITLDDLPQGWTMVDQGGQARGGKAGSAAASRSFEYALPQTWAFLDVRLDRYDTAAAASRGLAQARDEAVAMGPKPVGSEALADEAVVLRGPVTQGNERFATLSVILRKGATLAAVTLVTRTDAELDAAFLLKVVRRQIERIGV